MSTSEQNQPIPEEVVLRAVDQHVRRTGKPIWVADLYKEVGTLKFCRPCQFEDLLTEMIVVGLLYATYGWENIGWGRRLRICDISPGMAVEYGKGSAHDGHQQAMPTR